MSEKDLKINFRYLTGNIACMSVDSVSGKPVHNDIDNEEAIILFNSLVGEKEGCRTVKNLLQENEQLKTLLMQDHHKIHELADVIDEAMQHIKESCYYPELENYSNMTDEEVKELVQILDKVKEDYERPN